MNKYSIIEQILLIVLIANATCLTAEASDIKFRTIHSGHGLSNNQVNAIHKDSQGYMWFGTASGLNRYDGYNIKTYHSSFQDSTKLHDNYIQEIQEDSEGNLWIYAGENYSLFNPRTETFSYLTDTKQHELGLPANPNRIKTCGNDLWIAVRDNGLFKLDSLKILHHILKAPIDGKDITDIIPLKERNRVIAVTDKGGLYILNYTDGSIINTHRSPRRPHSFEEYSLFLDNNDRIWVYSILGINIFDLNADKWIDSRFAITQKNKPVKAINQDGEGQIWVGYDNEGLEVIDSNGVSQCIVNNSTDIYSLGNNSIRTIYRDNNNGMWVGTNKKGISVYYPCEYKFESTSFADVNCISQAYKDTEHVWIGTDKDGLLKYNYRHKRIVNSIYPDEKSNHAIVCLYPDDKGGVWIGTYNNGMFYYINGSTKHFTIEDGLSSNNIWAIVPYNGNHLLIGTLGGGIQTYDKTTNSFETFNTANSRLTTDYVNTIVKGRNGQFYIGTTYGICQFSPSAKSVSYLNIENLSNKTINQLLIDSRGLLWIATRDGLNVYDTDKRHLYPVVLNQSNPHQFILGIVEGADRSMWITVDSELYNCQVSFDRDSARYKFRSIQYGGKDGIVSGTFNQRSMCLLPTGDILAGNLSGIVKIDPANIEYNQHAPKVKFTDIYLKNERLEIGNLYDGRVILPEGLAYLSEINLNYNQNDITVYFTTDNFSNSECVIYEYMLEGFSDEWTLCTRGIHHAVFTNLSPGIYTLKTRAINGDGIGGSEETSLIINIKAPWWATWWAKVIYGILLVAAFVSIIILVKNREHRKFKLRQKEDQDRKTQELNQLKFKFFTNISHELRTPLTLILAPVDSMLKECDKERDIKRLTTIKNNASRLLYLVNQLLDFRKNEMAGLKLHLSSGDMVQTIISVCQSFSELSERRDIKIDLVCDADRIDMAYDNDKITKTFMNLLSNAMKYTPEGGSIQVKIKQEDTNVVISVADTGKGITAEDKQHIFEHFYRSADQSDLNTGTGIGLSLVYEYVNLHGGNVCVEDNKPCGTVFTVYIPFRKNEAIATEEPRQQSEPTDILASEASKENETPGHVKPKVLFVDDNEDMTEFLKDEFSQDYDVVCASDGIKALEETKKHDFDLIVSDIMMPNMDGIQLSRELKGNAATVDVPVIMLTAKHDVNSVIEGLTLGADDYITKPFNNIVLAIKMKRLISLKRKGLKRTLIEPTPSEIHITSLDEQLIDKAVKYVEENMSRSDLTVEELSKHLGMSRVHLYKKILALTGKTPVEFIRILRLKRAAQYLRDSQLNVSEIAYKLGFNNPKYFTKYFKEEFGISPSEYQNKEGQ